MKPFRTSVRAIPRSGRASRPERRGSRAGLLSDAGRACEGRRPVISQHEQRTHEEDRRRAVLFCRPRPVCDEYRRHSRPTPKRPRKGLYRFKKASASPIRSTRASTGSPESAKRPRMASLLPPPRECRAAFRPSARAPTFSHLASGRPPRMARIWLSAFSITCRIKGFRAVDSGDQKAGERPSKPSGLLSRDRAACPYAGYKQNFYSRGTFLELYKIKTVLYNILLASPGKYEGMPAGKTLPFCGRSTHEKNIYYPHQRDHHGFRTDIRCSLLRD